MDLEKLIQYRNEQNPFNRRLGIVLEEVRMDGYARTRKIVQPDDVNPLNVTHGGIYFTMADTTGGSAIATRGHPMVTINATYHFFRSASPGDILTAEARITKAGSTICVCDVRITDQRETLLGTGTFTYYLLPEDLPME